MAYLSERVLDYGLSALRDATHLHICVGEPTSAEACMSLSCGCAPVTVSAPGPRANGGRGVTVPAQREVSVTNTGNVRCWVLTGNGHVFAHGPLPSSSRVQAGNVFNLGEIDIIMPGA
jgi:hypothetical protein